MRPTRAVSLISRLAAALALLLLPLGLAPPGPALAGERVSPDWYVVFLSPGTTPSFAFGPDDSLHLVTFGDELHQENGPVVYWQAASPAGPWMKIPLTEGYYYGPGDLLVTEGAVHAAFHDHFGNPLHMVIRPGQPIEIHFIRPAGPHDGWDNSLALDSQGRLHMSCVSPILHGATASLEYGIFDGATWTFGLIPGSDPFIYGFGTSLALDAADRPHIVFCTADQRTAPGDLVLATKGESGWEFETVLEGGLRGRFARLAIGADGRFHLAWCDLEEGELIEGEARPATVFYAVRDGSSPGAAWSIEPVADLAAVRLDFADAHWPLSLVLDQAGGVHLAFGDARKVVYASREGEGWRLETVLESSSHLYRGAAVLRLDSQGNPAIATWEDSPSNPEGNVKIAMRRVKPAPLFHRADIDGSGDSDISDAVRIFGYLFLGLAKPTCLESADTNNSGRIDISDGVFLLNYLFIGSASPPSPGFADSPCGTDPDVPESAGDLGCVEYLACTP